MLERTPSRSRNSERLSARRRRAKRRFWLALGVLVLILLGGALWGIWQPSARITRVMVVSGDPSLANYATEELSGRDFGIFPRNSILFPPEGAIRSAILADHPEIAAVSIYRAGVGALAIKADDRTAVARWCGAAPLAASGTPASADLAPEAGGCYVFDGNGLIYAALDGQTGTSTASTTAGLPTPAYLVPLNPFTLYAPLADASASPLRATLADANAIPATFDFARQLAAFGSPVVSIYTHPITDASSTAAASAEVDDTLASGTRVLYVLGQEEEAYAALASAENQMKLADGSLDYVDLRFAGKIYLKPKE